MVASMRNILKIFFIYWSSYFCSCNEEDMANIIRQFSSRIAYSTLASDKLLNFGFSGLRVVHELISMHSVGSDETKKDISLWLGYEESKEVSGCQILKKMTSYPDKETVNVSVSFKQMLFHRENLKLDQKVLQNECFQNQIRGVDFTKTLPTMDDMNSWYDVTHETFYNSYFEHPPKATTDIILMSVLHLYVIDTLSLFQFADDIDFITLKKESAKVNSMQASGNIFYEVISKVNCTIYRYDLDGGRFSMVFMVPMFMRNLKEELLYFFTSFSYSKALLEAMALKKATKMTLTVPEIEFSTRMELKDSLSTIGFKFFDEKNPLDKLSKEKILVSQIPYSEFIKVVADIQSDSLDHKKFTINCPFVYSLVDRQFNIPLYTGVYTGVTPDFE